MLLPKFVICNISEPVEPSNENPFIVVVDADQPIALRTFDPFAGHFPLPNSKTAVILIITDELTSLGNLTYQALIDAVDAEGVILLDELGNINAVLPADDVLLGLNDNYIEEVEVVFGQRGQYGYGALSGKEPDVTVSYVYCCPVPGCPSPDWHLLRKGMKPPLCPFHKIPRELIRKLS